MKKVNFVATGLVYGRLWGSGEGSYSATPIKADTLEELMNKANRMLDNGSLDSGMGYERLLGAKLDIQTITKIEIDGKEFTNTELDTVFIGDLTEEQQDFLENQW